MMFCLLYCCRRHRLANTTWRTIIGILHDSHVGRLWLVRNCGDHFGNCLIVHKLFEHVVYYLRLVAQRFFCVVDLTVFTNATTGAMSVTAEVQLCQVLKRAFLLKKETIHIAAPLCMRQICTPACMFRKAR